MDFDGGALVPLVDVVAWRTLDEHAVVLAGDLLLHEAVILIVNREGIMGPHEHLRVVDMLAAAGQPLDAGDPEPAAEGGPEGDAGLIQRRRIDAAPAGTQRVVGVSPKGIGIAAGIRKVPDQILRHLSVVHTPVVLLVHDGGGGRGLADLTTTSVEFLDFLFQFGHPLVIA